MFNIGGILKSLVNPATLLQLAAGPAGWASLAVRTIGTAIAQQVIQAIGDKLGLPPAITNLAQQAFSAAAGAPDGKVFSVKEAVSQVAQQLNLSPQAAGNLERTANDSLARALAGVQKGNLASSVEDEGGPQSFLVALAKALGKQMDQKAGQIATLANEISNATAPSAAGSLNGQTSQQGISAESTKISGKSTLLQAYSQELGVLSNAASNAIKSIGEAQTTLARKG
jgi:hypothetical protein